MEGYTIETNSYFSALSLLDQIALIDRQLLIVQYSSPKLMAEYKSIPGIYDFTASFLEVLFANRVNGELRLDIEKFRDLIDYYNRILNTLESELVQSETTDFQDRIDFIVENIKVVRDNLISIFHFTEADLRNTSEA